MDTPTRRTLYRYYRIKEFPYLAGAFTAAGILFAIKPEILPFPMPGFFRGLFQAIFATSAFVNGITFILAIAARITYRLRPYCPACGLDAVECKINRNSLSAHQPEHSQ